MKQIFSMLATISLGLAATACGDSIYACDFRDPMKTEQRCQERTSNLPVNETAFEGTCETAQGTFLTDGCPRTDVVGGCDITSGPSGENVVNIYYAPMTAADVEQICMTEGSTFVASP